MKVAEIGLAGEVAAAQLVYLGVTSRVFDRPASMAVKGVSSAGKSYTVEQVLRFFPDDAYYALTAMSERALAYLDEPLLHRFLVLYEAAGIGDEMASYLIRSLLSENRIRYVTVDKTDGELAAREIEIPGPTGLPTTSTRDLHPENETRLLTIGMTDTADQTRRVLDSIADETRRSDDLDDWRSLQAWIASTPAKVTIPYAKALASLVLPIAVRLRRDFTQLLTLIRAHAVLHRGSRETDEAGRIIASIDDYTVVRGLVAHVISEGLGAGVSDATRETVDAVRELVAVQLSPDDGVKLKALADRFDLERSTVTRRVQVARRAGYVLNLEQKRGQPMRLVIGDPLPDQVEIFPTPEQVAQGVHDLSGGVRTPNAQHFSIPEPEPEGGVQVCSSSPDVRTPTPRNGRAAAIESANLSKHSTRSSTNRLRRATSR